MTKTTLLGLALTALVAIAPRPASAQVAVRTTYTQPSGAYETYSEETTSTRSIIPLQIVGTVALAGAWLASPLVTAAVGGDGADIAIMSTPLVGPWLCLGGVACDPEGYEWSLILSGTLQVSGLLMIILGSAIRTEVTSRRAALDPAIHLGSRARVTMAGAGLRLDVAL